MSWVIYRQRLLAANPHLGTPEARVSLTAASLLRQLEKAYRQGVKDLEHDEKTRNRGIDVPDFMKELFGSFRQGDGQ